MILSVVAPVARLHPPSHAPRGSHRAHVQRAALKISTDVTMTDAGSSSAGATDESLGVFGNTQILYHQFLLHPRLGNGSNLDGLTREPTVLTDGPDPLKSGAVAAVGSLGEE